MYHFKLLPRMHAWLYSYKLHRWD